MDGFFWGSLMISTDAVLVTTICLRKYESYVNVYAFTSERLKAHWMQNSVSHPECDKGRFVH
eukprot:CAMPEP_0172578990 /NCGR_PEP_ID=MMETSP1067-20121228/139018_1 /TAXON_ID=265564 ORGANISM="Thalassiosira punctigera, Strain Tpunct2005C2" /NCGR_SAMPLE_ID=MMETSP1067 /ASSEMBLY_ACC=CAM_ASM_000444 /LENGTH=61 /DNA_ID=CAMNT_0013371697 /DNA_START=363 /DNA_END=548 /DNA_ORIENTATION=+